jgi:hypothetical protein
MHLSIFDLYANIRWFIKLLYLLRVLHDRRLRVDIDNNVVFESIGVPSISLLLENTPSIGATFARTPGQCKLQLLTVACICTDDAVQYVLQICCNVNHVFLLYLDSNLYPVPVRRCFN